MCVTAAGKDPSVMSLSRSASTLFAAATAPAPMATVRAPSATKGRAVQRVRGGRVNGVVRWFNVCQFLSASASVQNMLCVRVIILKETWMPAAKQAHPTCTHFS